MKSVFSILILTLVMITVSAQESAELKLTVDETTGLITYKEVVDEPGIKDTLYNRGASWLHTFYKNPWEVAKVRDQSTGLIKIQHQFKIYENDEQGNKLEAGMILYIAKLEFKDNRYRVVIDNFVYKQVSRYPVEKWLDKTAPDYNVKWEDYLVQIDFFTRYELIKSLKEKMKPGKPIKEDIW